MMERKNKQGRKAVQQSSKVVMLFSGLIKGTLKMYALLVLAPNQQTGSLS